MKWLFIMASLVSVDAFASNASAPIELLPVYESAGEWRFLGGQTQEDESGNANRITGLTNATISGEVITCTSGTGAGYVADSASLTPGSISISLWYYFTNNVPSGSVAVMLGKEGSGTDRAYYIALGTDNASADYDVPFLIVSQNGTAFSRWQADGNYSAMLTNWTHLVAIHNASVADELWVNGVKVPAVYTVGSVLGAVNNNAAALTFGRRLSASDGFGGRLSRIRIYHRVLSEDEVLMLHQEGPPQ